MIVPAPRLLWVLAIAAFPLALVAALYSTFTPAALGAGAILVAVVIADAASSRRTLRGLAVELPPLVRLFKDREAGFVVRVHNPAGRSRRVRIGLVFPTGIESPDEDRFIDLPADSIVSEFTWLIRPHKRGQYKIQRAHAEANTPLGLWAARGIVPTDMEVRVYPNLRRQARLAALRRGSEGIHALRQIGKGREFEKLREYVPGDDFDEIHWKATARRGRPITKVFQVERTQEIYAVIDASRLSSRRSGDEDTALERFLHAGLILGAAAERRGDLFGLAAFSDRVEAFVRARNGKAHYAACRDAIYRLHARAVSPDFDELAMFLRLRLRRRALLVFLTSLDDPVLAESFVRASRMLARQHLVLAAMPAPENIGPLFADENVESEEDVYQRLGGHLAWRHLRELELDLRRNGVRFSLVEPAIFPARLVSLYDEIKQRQLL